MGRTDVAAGQRLVHFVTLELESAVMDTRVSPEEEEEEEEEEDCPFCRIVKNQTDTEILLEDDELLCFKDLKPAALHHFLIIPRIHIQDCMSLQEGHVALVERMERMGRSVLGKVCDLEDIRLGFHVPPFSSVPHLHLHALAPGARMALREQLRYGPQSHWFITVESVLTQLRLRGKVR